MRYPSRLIIALCSMVVVPVFTHNPVHAQNTDPGADAPSSSGEETSASKKASEADGAASIDKSARRSKRKTTPAETAPADTAAPDAAPPTKFFGPAQRNHKYQTGFSLLSGSGYRLVVPYQDGQACGDSSGMNTKRVCSSRIPFFLDLQLSFGISARVDLFAELRFGLEDDPAIKGSKQIAFAPGVRFWLDQDVALKFFTTVQFVYDFTDFSSSRAGIRSSDFGIRNANGLMYDPIRNVGFYVQFGETAGFVRWFHVYLDIGLGVQVRFP
jgi:hypothetical protein